MKSTKKIIKGSLAIISTLFVTAGAVLAVDISLGADSVITAEIWSKISTVMDKIALGSGDEGLSVSSHVEVKKICAVTETYLTNNSITFADKSITLSSGDAIDTTTWGNLKEKMAQLDVAADADTNNSITDGEDVLSIATGGTVYVLGNVCVPGEDNTLGTSDDVCLTASDAGACFGS